MAQKGRTDIPPPPCDVEMLSPPCRCGLYMTNCPPTVYCHLFHPVPVGQIDITQKNV